MTDPGLTAADPYAGLPAAVAEADAAVPRLWRDLGLPGLVDVHVHFLPPRMQAAVWAYFDVGDRVVLGSDFPNIPYPYATQLDALARLDLGDDWLRGVLWTNGARLLGLDPPG